MSNVHPNQVKYKGACYGRLIRAETNQCLIVLEYMAGLVTNSIIFLLVKNQWPLIEETLFSSVLPSNSLVAVLNPWKAFWADMVTSRDFNLASWVITEKQGHGLVCCTRRRGPETLSKNIAPILIVRLLKPHFFTPILDFEKSTEYNCVT